MLKPAKTDPNYEKELARFHKDPESFGVDDARVKEVAQRLEEQQKKAK